MHLAVYMVENDFATVIYDQMKIRLYFKILLEHAVRKLINPISPSHGKLINLYNKN